MKKINLVLSLVLLLSVSSLAQQQLVDKVVAIVGNNIVTLSDIDAQYFQYQAQGAKGGKELKCSIYENMILQKLLVAQAVIDSVEVTDKEVESELDNRLQGFIRQAGSIEKLEAYFNKSLEEIKEDFRDDVRDQLITSRMQNQILGDIDITPAEVNKYYRELPKDSLPLIESEYEYAQILNYPKSSEEEIKALKDKLLGFKKRIETGKSKFGTLVVLYSEDPGSAKNGGDLGFITRAELVPEFAAVAFNLKPNEISDVVKTDFGYHIIQLLEKRGDQIHVRHILMKPSISYSAEKASRDKLDSIANVVRKDTLTYEQAAQIYSEDEDTRLNGGICFNMYTGSQKFTKKELPSEDLHQIKKMNVGEISKAYEAKDKNGNKVYKNIKLISKSEAHIANLKDDYQKIKDMALEKKKQEALYDWVLEKQKTNYVKIDDEFKSCNFHYKGWFSN